MSTLLKMIGVLILSLTAFGVFLYFSFPHVATLRYLNPGRTALMVERGGEVRQNWAPLSRISPYLRRAVVAAEDSSFYEHNGIDVREMQESVRKNIRKKRFARGFSTITMQLAKNLYLSPQKTVTRKLLEILIAWKMDHELSKDRILEIYLNVIEWGKGVYGAEAAARHYFKKSAAGLTPDEAAFLAAILPNPRKWGRWPPGPYVRKRMEIILFRM